MQQVSYCALPATGNFKGSAPPSARSLCKGSWSVHADRRERNSTRAASVRGRVASAAGSWVSEAGGRAIWQPSGCPGYSWLNFADALHCLQGRVLVIEGDSTARQCFLRLLWWLRGVPVFVEHFFHRHALYLFNRTHDEFHPIGVSVTQWWKVGARDKTGEVELLTRLATAMNGGSSQGAIVFRFAGTVSTLERKPEENFYVATAQHLAGLVFGFRDKFTLRWRDADVGEGSTAEGWREEVFRLDEMNSASLRCPCCYCSFELCLGPLALPRAQRAVRIGTWALGELWLSYLARRHAP